VTAVGAVNVGAVVFPVEAPPVGKELEAVVATKSAAFIVDEITVEEISVDDGDASSIAIVLLVAELVPTLATEILLEDTLEDGGDEVSRTRELLESVLDEDEDDVGTEVGMIEDATCENDAEDGTAATEVEEGAGGGGGPWYPLVAPFLL